MSAINAIISTMSVEDKVTFIAQLKKKNRRGDTKNIALFNILGHAPNTSNIDQLIYGKPNKGAYHALCKRLHDSLIDFIATRGFKNEQSEEMEVFKLLLVSRIFFEQKAYKIGFKTLQKAELKAKKNSFYSILTEVYYTKLQYAHWNTKIDFDQLLIDFELNKKFLEQEERMNLCYAQIQQDLKVVEITVLEIIEDRLQQFSLKLNKDITYRSLFKLMEVVNTAANLTRDFVSILPFVDRLQLIIEAKELQKEKHLFYHIHILYFMANIYFRNRNYAASESILEQVGQYVTDQKSTYYKLFYPRFMLLKILNANYSGNFKKASISVESLEFSNLKEQLEYKLDLLLLKAIIYMQQLLFKKAMNVFKEFNHSDQFYVKKVGEPWVIKKNLAEILLFIELDHFDLFESRIKSFRKKHQSYLVKNKESRVLQFLSLVTEFYFQKEKKSQEYFLNKINTSFKVEKTNQEDIFVLSFFAWLKSKIKNTNVYETTLELVN